MPHGCKCGAVSWKWSERKCLPETKSFWSQHLKNTSKGPGIETTPASKAHAAASHNVLSAVLRSNVLKTIRLPICLNPTQRSENIATDLHGRFQRWDAPKWNYCGTPLWSSLCMSQVCETNLSCEAPLLLDFLKIKSMHISNALVMVASILSKSVLASCHDILALSKRTYNKQDKTWTNNKRCPVQPLAVAMWQLNLSTTILTTIHHRTGFWNCTTHQMKLDQAAPYPMLVRVMMAQ